MCLLQIRDARFAMLFRDTLSGNRGAVTQATLPCFSGSVVLVSKNSA